MLSSDHPLHLREIAAGVDRDASNVYRYLVSFAEAGLVTQEESTGRYDLGPMAIQLGLAALRRIDGLAIATDYLARLVQSVEADGHVTAWGSHGPTVLRWLGRPSDVVVRIQEGSVLPVTGTATGRLWASFLPDKMIDPIAKREFSARPTDGRTLAEQRGWLAAELKGIRKNGFSYASGERRAHVDALCAPIFDRNGAIAYAITLIGPSPTLSPDITPEMLRALIGAAQSASERMGYITAPVTPQSE